MSCTKSYVGTIAGILAGSGQLDLTMQVKQYLPELCDSGFGGGTIQQLLDMSVGAKFDEDYANPHSDINIMDYAIGWRARPQGYAGPTTMLSALQNVQEMAFEHGARFDYRSPVSDVLGLVLERVSGRYLSELLRDLIWVPLGCEYSACITIDSNQQPLSNGGLCTSLRDFARFGQLVLNGGVHEGQQLIPAGWVQDCQAGDADSIRAWQASSYVNRVPGGVYRNQWWCRDRAAGVLMASGIHGQNLYVHPPSGTVVAKFSSQPEPRNDEVFGLQFALLAAIANSYL
jgi:CubicO group peptidase (beta-lactamase class C family)